jgi:DNA-binding NtrC family response regulator
MEDATSSNSTVKSDEGFIEVVGGTLVVLSEGGEPARDPVPIGPEPCIVGRGDHCHVSIADSHMSTSHCSLAATSLGVRISDQESRNGTFIHQARIKSGGSVYLTSNGRIRCGHTWMEIRVTGPEHVPISGAVACGSLIGRSILMRQLFARIERLAPTRLNILITGETGTGKELVAQALHDASGRKGKLVTIDCGSIPPSLAESALFGHERGSFTGAISKRVSPFLEAGGGTVFIDELGELPEELQPKLLRALEARQIQAVGSTRYEPIDVRVIAATRRDLHVEMNAGRFRNDLYFRVAQRCLELPPLRERREDIPDLVARFLIADLEDPGALSRIDAPEMERLKRYDWPGNVRELRNVVLAAHVESNGGPIEFGELLNPRKSSIHLSDRVAATQSFAVQRDALLAAFVRDYFTALHAEARGNVSEMSRRAGLSRGQVRTYLERVGLREES